MLPQPINIVNIAARDGYGLTYVIKDSDGIINVSTQLGPVTLYLPNIRNSGLLGNPRRIVINCDAYASLNAVTLMASGGDTIYGQESLLLNVDNSNTECMICDLNKWAISDLSQRLAIYPDQEDTNALQFLTDGVYGTTSDPLTGDITLSASNLARAKRGVANLIIHNDASEPNYPAAFKLLNGEYTNDVNNFIYATFVDENTILYTISQIQS